MSTQVPNTSTNPSSLPPKKEGGKKNNLVAIAAAIIVLLLALNAFLLVSYNKRGKVNADLTSQLDESEELKLELEKQYYDALSELDEMRGSNEELNALIEQQKTDLTEQKDKVERLLVSKHNLDAARRELKEMKAQVDGYLAEINQLRADNQQLLADKAELTNTNQGLTQSLEAERMTNQDLNSSQAALMSKVENLEDDNEKLNSAATSLKVRSLEVSGERLRRSGKAVKRSNAKNVEQINICFESLRNELAPPGNEVFFVRVINPLGQTMVDEEFGSPTFTNFATGEEYRYTTRADFDYTGTAENMCVVYAPTAAFQSGEYTVEVYNKGLLAGTSVLLLK